MVSVPVEQLPHLNEIIKVKVSIPRTTANTHMFEEVNLAAMVIRHEPMMDDSLVGVALKFDQPLPLGLDA